MSKKTKIEFEPILRPCTYHSLDPKTGVCRNCNDMKIYKDGYYMIITHPSGKKTGFVVDTIK